MRGSEMRDQPGLFTPVKVGSLELPNRIVMSPMTRIRAGEGCVPSERMVRYYSQRASTGLIITEGTHPSPMGRGYNYPPGLHTEEQAAGWRKVTDAGTSSSDTAHLKTRLMWSIRWLTSFRASPFRVLRT